MLRPAPHAFVVLAVAALGFGGPDEVTGQGIDGIVRLQASGGPAPGVLVSAYTGAGERVRATLTDGTGGFSMDVPPGRYRLQAERIGLSTSEVDGVVVTAGDRTFQRLEMTDRPIELAGLVVDSRVRSCRTGAQEAARVQRWWSEVRTALGVSAALQDEEFGTFLVERFDRVWDDDREELIASRRRWQVSTSTRPFVSAPAEDLMDRGFVTGRFGIDREYFGPDADVLLSTAFLSAHCFRLDDDREDDGQLGLRFEPAEERRTPDIEGTFWIDTTTATLTDLDFEYTDLDGPDADGAGGGARFTYLPSGAWIVSEWFISIPRTGVRGRSNRLRTIGYFDGGGAVTPLDVDADSGAETGAIEGTVNDRVRGSPLEGAVVSVLGTEHQATTDAAGRFRLPGVPAGLRYLWIEHPDLASWGIEAHPHAVEVRARSVIGADLATPTFEEAALDLCLDAGVDASTVVTGTILGPEARPVYGARVQLAYEVARESLDRITVSTDESGRFAICSAPAGALVTLALATNDGWREVAELQASEGRITSHQIRLVR